MVLGCLVHEVEDHEFLVTGSSVKAQIHCDDLSKFSCSEWICRSGGRSSNVSGTKWALKLRGKVHNACGSLRFFEDLCQQPIGWMAQVPMDSHESLEGTLLCVTLVVLGDVPHDFGDGWHDRGLMRREDIFSRALGTSFPRSCCD